MTDEIYFMQKEKSKQCHYNTSKSASFKGYCDHPRYYEEWGHRLVECKGCPCPDWKQRQEEED
jgi:hypothetical protein